jgi:predicted regulator of Ras-like GTPase activity (Roadblock/LC7/MglB family)
MSKQEQLGKVISELKAAVPEIMGVSLASLDGLNIISDLEESNAARIAALTATASGLGKRVTTTLSLGEDQELVIRGEKGLFSVYRIENLAVLAVLTRAGANLGLINLEARTAVSKIKDILAS